MQAGRKVSAREKVKNFMSIKMINMAHTQFQTSNIHRERVHTRKAFSFTGLRDGNVSISASYSGGPRFRCPPIESKLSLVFLSIHEPKWRRKIGSEV